MTSYCYCYEASRRIIDDSDDDKSDGESCFKGDCKRCPEDLMNKIGMPVLPAQAACYNVQNRC